MGLKARLVDFQAQLLVVPASHHRPIDGVHFGVAFENDAGDARERLGHHHHQVADSTDAMLSQVDDLSVEEIAEEDHGLLENCLNSNDAFCPPEPEEFDNANLKANSPSP